MKKFVEFDSLSEAQTFADNLDAEVIVEEGAADATLKGVADQYSKPIEHPSNGKAVVLTCPNCHQFMTQAQIDAAVDHAGAIALGYSQFVPPPEILEI